MKFWFIDKTQTLQISDLVFQGSFASAIREPGKWNQGQIKAKNIINTERTCEQLKSTKR